MENQQPLPTSKPLTKNLQPLPCLEDSLEEEEPLEDRDV
jgi:hypothetical protein